VSEYEHRQLCPLPFFALVAGLGGAVVAVALTACGDPERISMLVGSGWAVFAFGMCFAPVFLCLRVRDERNALAVEFWPVRLVRAEVPYEAIESVEKTTVSQLHRWQVRQGRPVRVYGARAGDAVQMNLKRDPNRRLPKAIIVGTDDADGLLAFLRGRIGAGPRYAGANRKPLA
jgi:hypothetical protein